MEVVDILKKAVLLGFALCFAFCSHLRPCCDFCVEGSLVSSRCSLIAAERAKAAATAAAEEILPTRASLPEAKMVLRLTLGRSADSAPELADALLRKTPGVMLGEAVYVRGQRLGTVSDAESFGASLDRYIENTLPTWAKTGSVRGLGFKKLYTRKSYEVPHGDMIMLITGLSPVMYTDGMGRVSPV